MKKVYIETYGCQMNVADTEVVFSILEKHGYGRTQEMDEADVIMANTCSIRDNAEQRILGRIEQFVLQRRHRDVIIGILGCMAERMKEQLLSSGKVDLVAGPDTYRHLPELLEAAGEGHPQIDVILSREETYADIAPVRIDKNGVSAFISIMRGCNNVCSYCVVPYTRGVERSRDAHSIVREACECRNKGYKEVTLLGQNVDSYKYEDVTFARLLEMVAQVSPSLRVRFSTSNPQDISDEVIEVMARYPNIWALISALACAVGLEPHTGEDASSLHQGMVSGQSGEDKGGDAGLCHNYRRDSRFLFGDRGGSPGYPVAFQGGGLRRSLYVLLFGEAGDTCR